MVDPVKFTFVRHDVDVNLIKAVDIARLDALHGISSTFYIRVSASGYDINTLNSRNAIDSILLLGHDIGLHYDSYNDTDIKEAADILEGITGCAVDTFSYHRPKSTEIGGALKIGGMVNAYAKELMGWYISDSSGQWRCGEPIGHIESHSKETLQVLVHPVWWGSEKIDQLFRDGVVKRLEAGK